MKILLISLAGGMLFAGFAAADTIASVADVESELTILANDDPGDPDLTALATEIEEMFGPGQVWTTAGNIAEIDYSLSLVTTLGGGDSLIEPELQVILDTTEAESSDDDTSGTPEPATLVLLAGGLFFLVGYAAKRYGTRQPTDRSGSD